MTIVGVVQMQKQTGAKRALAPVTRANGDQTKEKILDAAEELFGAHTFDTVSLRDITNHADVTLALASYHFGTKDNLFSAVVARRASILNRIRVEKLEELEREGNTSVETLLDAFMRPLFDQTLTGGAGWKAYVSLISKVAMTDRWHDLVRTNFDETANLFVARLRTLRPRLSDEALYRGFSFTLQLGLQVVSQNQRVDALSGGRYSGSELERSYAMALKYVSAGMLGLED